MYPVVLRAKATCTLALDSPRRVGLRNVTSNTGSLHGQRQSIDSRTINITWSVVGQL